MTWDIRRTAVLAAFACSVNVVVACDDSDKNRDDEYYNARLAPGGGGVSTTKPGSNGSGRAGSGGSDKSDAGAGGHSGSPSDHTDDDRDDAELLVEVEQGELRGRWAEHDTRVFLGIPYAEPPLGELRWAAPTEPAAWKKGNVRDATEYADRCPQLSPAAPRASEATSEDCLYLNIWAPRAPARAGVPVVVWIHGGDHVSGSASDQAPSGGGSYSDGSVLAAHGVVVVSFNYRLGALGFLAHSDLDAERSPYGDQGLRDQVAALQWVQDNIAEFGGDARNVTIVGQGSGAADVCMHVVSPLSQRLFQQAIGQSGGCTTYQAQPADVEHSTAEWVADVGCDDARDQLACLRKVSLEALQEAAASHREAFVPVVDGDFLPDQPRQLYERARFQPVPYVIGSNADDGTQFSADFTTVKTSDDYHAILTKQFPDLSLQTLCEIYPHDEFGASPEGYRKALVHLYGDAFVRCAVEDTARRASESTDVYLYQFAVLADGNDLGPSFGAEIGYVFGTETRLSTKQQKVSALIQSYWVDFARDGFPDRDDDLPAWPPLSSKDESRMQFAFDSKLVDATSDEACDYWRSVYDARFPVQR